MEAKEAISKIKSSFWIYELLELVNPLRIREIFKGVGAQITYKDYQKFAMS